MNQQKTQISGGHSYTLLQNDFFDPQAANFTAKKKLVYILISCVDHISGIFYPPKEIEAPVTMKNH